MTKNKFIAKLKRNFLLIDFPLISLFSLSVFFLFALTIKKFSPLKTKNQLAPSSKNNQNLVLGEEAPYFRLSTPRGENYLIVCTGG